MGGRPVRSIELVAIEPPGRGSRIDERPFVRLDVMLDARAGAAPYLDKPAAMFGHCLGGLTMFETTRRALSAGRGHLPRVRLGLPAAPRARRARPLRGGVAATLTPTRRSIRCRELHEQPDAVFARVIQQFDIGVTDEFLAQPELRESAAAGDSRRLRAGLPVSVRTRKSRGTCRLRASAASRHVRHTRGRGRVEPVHRDGSSGFTSARARTFSSPKIARSSWRRSTTRWQRRTRRDAAARRISLHPNRRRSWPPRKRQQRTGKCGLPVGHAATKRPGDRDRS